MEWIEYLKVIILGIVEGITEWLPISSTGHLILVDEFMKLNMSDAFKEMFDVLVQLGAILAVIVIYFKKLLPVDLVKKVIIPGSLHGTRINLFYGARYSLHAFLPQSSEFRSTIKSMSFSTMRL